LGVIAMGDKSRACGKLVATAQSVGLGVGNGAGTATLFRRSGSASEKKTA
jgi:hypothetical protein